MVPTGSDITAGVGYWAEGQLEKKWRLCRCRKSANKPFCDGTQFGMVFGNASSGESCRRCKLASLLYAQLS
ncbi:CDGSH iron-sulfur domain-containing protein [Hoeflea poritis]|uniref:CDGSH iron-sulfur domain-containing protein n=1 Tax=Hoeflea poritis TaxID=2993659 RepID=UPI003CCDFAAA